VFAEALKRATPEARAAYLDEACGVDATLRWSVEALLRAVVWVVPAILYANMAGALEAIR
jgi:hypothetical protein